MPFYEIDGGKPLEGIVHLQGAKNAALPMLAASMLARDGKVELTNVPQLRDISVCLSIQRLFGCQTKQTGSVVLVDAAAVQPEILPQSLCEKMRSSVLFLAPMLCRFGKAKLYLPGGCLLGERPIDLHIKSLEKMGAVCRCEGCRLQAYCPNGLHGADIVLSYPSVGATENIVMAATLAEGKTRIYGAAKEPEIGELTRFLCLMGANITTYPDHLEIIGVSSLHGCHTAVMSDRIAAFTYMAAALVTNGEIEIENCPLTMMKSAAEFIQKVGGVLKERDNRVTVKRAGAFLLPIDDLQSGPYPAFATDDGAAALVLMALANGKSRFRETVFSGRFAVTEQLKKFGADITVHGDTAYLCGVDRFYAAKATATDLRAGAALIVAALGADGHSQINGGEHICRGYQEITKTLRSLGAKITERS